MRYDALSSLFLSYPTAKLRGSMRFVPSRKSSRKSKFPIALQKLGVHAVLAVAAFAVLGGLAYVQSNTFATVATKAGEVEVQPPVEIGLEYDAQVSMHLTFARKGNAGTLLVEGDATTPLKISLPTTWQRMEVFNATLDSVTAESPEFGFTRWTLPAGAGMRLNLLTIPDSISLVTPSRLPSSVKVDSIDLLKNTHAKTTRLLNIQADVALWQVDEL